MNKVDVLALGTCYVDTNLSDYPFSENGIAANTELVGGAYKIEAGGSAVNFCKLLGSLGLRTAFVGIAGTDPNGDSLVTALEASGIDPFLVREEGLLTNISFNMTSPSGNHIMLVAGTANEALNPQTALPKLEEALAEARQLYLGGCFKLKKLAPAFGDIAAMAERHGVAIIVDHGRVPEAADEAMRDAVKGLVKKAAYYLPSRKEFCQLWGVTNIEEGLRLLATEAPQLRVVVKDGADGAHYWDGAAARRVPAPRIEKVAVATGAGDSFNAGLMHALAHDFPFEEAVAYGCVIAAAKIADKPLPESAV